MYTFLGTSLDSVSSKDYSRKSGRSEKIKNNELFRKNDNDIVSITWRDEKAID